MGMLLLTETAIMVIMAIARSKGGQKMKSGKICITGDTAYYTRVKRDDNEIAVNPEIIERNTKRIRRTIKNLKKSKDTKVIESRSR